MRNSFHRWLALALLFAMCFGAEAARADARHADWLLLAAYAVLCAMSAAAASDDYKNKD
jgi:plasmid replication initiation protein